MGEIADLSSGTCSLRLAFQASVFSLKMYPVFSLSAVGDATLPIQVHLSPAPNYRTPSWLDSGIHSGVVLVMAQMSGIIEG